LFYPDNSEDVFDKFDPDFFEGKQSRIKCSTAFVSAMEDVLDVYHFPYDQKYTVVCMDESTKQLIGEDREQILGKTR
jgi:hypothetical protein